MQAHEITPDWITRAVNDHEGHTKGLIKWLKRYQKENQEHDEHMVWMLETMIGVKTTVAWVMWRKYA